VQKAEQVLQVQVLQEQQARKEHQVLTVQYQVLLDLKVLQAQQDLVFLEVQVPQVPQVLLAQKEQPVQLEIQV
jgi:hypothetical protein